MDGPDFELDVKHLHSIGGGEPRHAEFTGTKALMLAVLEDGIRSYLDDRERLASEAEHWVYSSRRLSPFSFVVVCETLNLNPDAVRRMLLKLRHDRVAGKKRLRRARPNVRVSNRLHPRKSN